MSTPIKSSAFRPPGRFPWRLLGARSSSFWMLKQWQDWHLELFRLHSRIPSTGCLTTHSWRASRELAGNELLDRMLAGHVLAHAAVRHPHLNLLLQAAISQLRCPCLAVHPPHPKGQLAAAQATHRLHHGDRLAPAYALRRESESPGRGTNVCTCHKAISIWRSYRNPPLAPLKRRISPAWSGAWRSSGFVLGLPPLHMVGATSRTCGRKEKSADLRSRSPSQADRLAELTLTTSPVPLLA